MVYADGSHFISQYFFAMPSAYDRRMRPTDVAGQSAVSAGGTNPEHERVPEIFAPVSATALIVN